MSMLISGDSLPGKELFLSISIFFFYTGSLEEYFKYRSLHLRCLRICPEDLCILPKKSHLWEPQNIFTWFLQNNFKRNRQIGHAYVLILMDLGTWSDIIMYLTSTLWIYISTQAKCCAGYLSAACMDMSWFERPVSGQFKSPSPKWL